MMMFPSGARVRNDDGDDGNRGHPSVPATIITTTKATKTSSSNKHHHSSNSSSTASSSTSDRKKDSIEVTWIMLKDMIESGTLIMNDMKRLEEKGKIPKESASIVVTNLGYHPNTLIIGDGIDNNNAINEANNNDCEKISEDDNDSVSKRYDDDDESEKDSATFLTEHQGTVGDVEAITISNVEAFGANPSDVIGLVAAPDYTGKDVGVNNQEEMIGAVATDAVVEDPASVTNLTERVSLVAAADSAAPGNGSSLTNLNNKVSTPAGNDAINRNSNEKVCMVVGPAGISASIARLDHVNFSASIGPSSAKVARKEENEAYFAAKYLNNNGYAPKICATCGGTFDRVGMKHLVFLYPDYTNNNKVTQHPCEMNVHCLACYNHRLQQNKVTAELGQTSSRAKRWSRRNKAAM